MLIGGQTIVNKKKPTRSRLYATEESYRVVARDQSFFTLPRKNALIKGNLCTRAFYSNALRSSFLLSLFFFFFPSRIHCRWITPWDEVGIQPLIIVVTWNAPRFSFLRLSRHLSTFLSVLPTREFTASLSPLAVRFHHSLSLSLSLSLSCYSASIDSGMDHLIHPICIPLMLPVGRGMSAPTRRAVQCRTYGIIYPRSRSLDTRPLNFHKSVLL